MPEGFEIPEQLRERLAAGGLRGAGEGGAVTTRSLPAPG